MLITVRSGPRCRNSRPPSVGRNASATAAESASARSSTPRIARRGSVSALAARQSATSASTSNMPPLWSRRAARGEVRYDVERGVAQQVARALAEGPGAVVGVVELAGVQRQAAAPDARRQFVAQAFQQVDPLVELRLPRPRQPRPVGRGGRALVGQGRERVADLVEREADAL